MMRRTLIALATAVVVAGVLVATGPCDLGRLVDGRRWLRLSQRVAAQQNADAKDGCTKKMEGGFHGLARW